MNPDLASQRGLSGINRVPRKNTTAGTTTAVNIQRHPRCPFQDMRIKAAVAPSETLSAISQLTICAPRMPTTIVSWLTVTSLPRQAAGLTSAMYVGRHVRGDADRDAPNHAENYECSETVCPAC